MMIKRLMLGIALMLLASFSTAGCGGDSESETDAGAPASESTQPSATSGAAVSKLVGSWHRPQTCEEMLAAFEEAGLPRSRT
jgi:hypothetical protein